MIIWYEPQYGLVSVNIKMQKYFYLNMKPVYSVCLGVNV